MTAQVGLGVDTANDILDAFRHVAHDVISVYAQMATAIPGATGSTGTSAGDASLKAVTFNAPTGGGITLASSPVYTNGGTSETLSHVKLWDGPDGYGTDQLLWTAQLTVPQGWDDGDTFTLDELGLTLAPIATS